MASTRPNRPRRSTRLLLAALTLWTTACGTSDDAAVVPATNLVSRTTPAPGTTTEPSPPDTTTVSPDASSSVPTTTEPTDDTAARAAAESISTQFMQARSDHDGATLVSLMAADASFGGSELARAVDEYPLQSEWERVVGWRFLDPSCSAGSPDRVVCTYNIQDHFNERADKGPYPGNSVLLEISNGQIQSITHNFNADDFFAESEMKFFAWLRENHPDDLQLMLEDRPFLIAPVALTPESIELWTEHTAEYLASVG